MTPEQVAQLVAMAAASFPSMQEKDLRPTAELWLQLLGDLDFEVARTALAKVLLTARFWPTVAEIREAALSIQPAPGGPPSPEAAWEEVVRQVRRVGWVGTPKWSHPLVGRAAEALYGSWQALCANLGEDMAADRAHYMRIYQTLSQREQEAALLPPVVREMAQALGSRLAAGGALPGPGGKVVQLPKREG